MTEAFQTLSFLRVVIVQVWRAYCQVEPVRHFVQLAHIIKTILNLSLKFEPNYTSNVSSFHFVHQCADRLSPPCRIRKENSASCDCSVKLFQQSSHLKVSVSVSGLFLWLCILEEVYVYTEIDHYGS